MSVRYAAPLPGLAVLLLAGSVDGAQACSCATPDGETVRWADAAVIARLVEVTPLGESGKADFEYRIDRVFKGRKRIEAGQVLTVRSWRGEAGCGMPEHMNRRYGLFLDLEAQRWRSNLCLTVGPREMRRLASTRSFGWSTRWSYD